MIDNQEMKPSDEKERKREFARYLGVASTVGINMVLSTAIGFAIGYWLLDNYLNTYPWFTIIFLLLGIASGFKYLFKIAKKAGEKSGSN
jgi:ATP synthase protein I